ncbi:MAG: Pyruvate formate-lyase 1-activating enzyme [Sporanaerobacter sp.]|jgi:pyruvate formate lyase activating enzyme|uniref:AmmeMemoRadiSam system radical SAM enzyme n=1 Tax=Sporanaerobacter sp. TaxID=2010183 RepID=UPI003A0FD4C4
MKLKEALYYTQLEGKKVRCNLCPHGCIIDDKNIGICKARKNEGGKLYTLNYGKITSYAFDPIEKKPLYHFYPGSKIFSIGSFGCNLKCEFCQNWEIAHEKPVSIEIQDEDLLSLAKANGSIGIAYTYNEPSIWYEYVLYISKKVKNQGLKNVLVTNGYIQKEPLEEILPYIDAMNIDLKSFDESYYNRLCKGKLSSVLDTIEISRKSTWVEITTLIIEGENDSLDEIQKLSKWISEIDEDIPLHLTRYHPAYKMFKPPTSYDILVKAKDIAREYLNYVYIGNVWGIDLNTYCPNCGSKIVDRDLPVEIIGINNGKCAKCGKNIEIIY